MNTPTQRESSIQSFTIPGRLPGANDMIGATNHNRFLGAKLKRDSTELCAQYAMVAKINPIIAPVKVRILWVEKNKRRDLDNVCYGLKFILDGLVASRLLQNDTRAWIRGITHEFPEPDAINPRVEVFLIPFIVTAQL